MKKEIEKRLEKIKHAKKDISNEKQLLPFVELKEEIVFPQKAYLRLLETGSVEMEFEGITSIISLKILKEFHNLIKKFLREVGDEI